MISGFIYEWVDLLTGLKYIGRHEGVLEDNYIGSGTIFLQEYHARPNDFVRHILWMSETTTVEELKSKEEHYLSLILDEELYYGSSKKYYNQVRNSSGYTSIENPMNNRSVVERMIETRKEKGLKSPWEYTVEKYGYAKACEINSKNKVGNTNGSGNKGKPKSEEHKKKISLNRKGGKPKGWKNKTRV